LLWKRRYFRILPNFIHQILKQIDIFPRFIEFLPEYFIISWLGGRPSIYKKQAKHPKVPLSWESFKRFNAIFPRHFPIAAPATPIPAVASNSVVRQLFAANTVPEETKKLPATEEQPQPAALVDPADADKALMPPPPFSVPSPPGRVGIAATKSKGKLTLFSH
jgi:hypothetical protein